MVKELDEQIFRTGNQITEVYENDRSVAVLNLCDKGDALRVKRTQLERKIKQAQKELEQLKNEFNDHRPESMRQIK